jgi:segregation and condensation protein A
VSLAVRDLELDLDAFEGPFDLLLTLVLKDQLRPAEIDIAAIVVAFVEHLASHSRPVGAPATPGLAPPGPAAVETPGPSGPVPSTVPSGPDASAETLEREEESWWLDLDACGEFLVLIAALLEIKARHLFPDEEAELSDLEPEEAAEELARRLAEYRRMKEAAVWLRERLADERERYFRLGPAPLAPRPERRLAAQDPSALASALRGLAVEPPKVSLSHMALRFPPVTQFLERFRAVLRRRRVFDFDTEVTSLTRVEQAVAFLALLELRKAGEIALSQSAPFAPIRVSRLEHERILQWTARSA